jgi:thiamine biosynthesis lipoprotein
MRATGFRHVVLDATRGTVKFRVSGLELNLGAVGKGYALDRAAELLRAQWGVRSALLHGGGSSVYAIGSPPGDARGWPIRLKHPTESEQSLGTVYLRDAGLGTSAATFQFFEYNGRKLGHLLDPRTGWPANGTASASVISPTAAEADAMSTAAFVLGAHGADHLTRLRPATGAVVLSEGDPTLLASRATLPSSKGGEGRKTKSPLTPPLPPGEGVGGWGRRIFNLAPQAYSPPTRIDLL